MRSWRHIFLSRFLDTGLPLYYIYSKFENKNPYFLILILNQFDLNYFDFDLKSIYSGIILILQRGNQNHISLTSLQISNEDNHFHQNNNLQVPCMKMTL